jgi:uncharacterized protein (TIGR03083 family)
MADVGFIYAACRERLSELVRGLDDGQLATRVPATAEWTVHDVIAHQVGAVSDINAGRFDGIGTDPWTGAQVAARRDVPIDNLLAEWEQGSPQFEAGLTALGGTQAALAVADVWNHEQDIRGALSIEGGRDPVAEHLSIEGYCGARTGQIAESGLAPLRLRAGVDEWLVGEGAPGATVIAEPYELARLICGRRTAEQIRAYLWDGDPEPYVALLTAIDLAEPLPT